METVVINGTPRTELGKKATRALRKAGNIPCNLYGGKETLNFFAPETSFKRLIYTPEFRIAEINVDGKSVKAIVKDLQFGPVMDDLLHIDFQELVENVPVKVSVQLKLTGTPKGLVLGGKLEQPFKRLNIMALPKDLPSSIEVDVTEMDLGSIKRIKDLQIPGVTFLHAAMNPFAKVMIPRKAKEEVAATAATAAPAEGAKPEAAGETKAAEEKKK